MTAAIITLTCIAGYVGMAGITYRHAYVHQYRANKAKANYVYFNHAELKGYARGEAGFMAILWPLAGAWLLFAHVFTPPDDALLTDAERVAKLEAEIKRLESEAGIR